MSESELIASFLTFKWKLIRAWVMDAEDSYTNKARRSTKTAHGEANEAEQEFRVLLSKELAYGQQQRPEGYRRTPSREGEPRPQPRAPATDRHQSSALSNDCEQDEGA